MAHTKVTKNGTQNNGTANTFSYSGSFDVFKASEVEVELDNIALTFTTSTINESASPREYTVDYDNKTVHIGGANLTSSDNVTIQPVTDMGAPTPRATYSPGASVTSEDLNNNQLQVMRKAMEYDEQKLSSRGGNMTGNLHLGQNVDITFEGDNDNAYETTLTVDDPTSDKTITFPDTTGTVVTTGDTETVATAMIATNAVTTGKIADSNVTTAKIADSNVTTAKIADSNVTTAKIANSNVTTAKIAADAIDGTKIADDAISNEHLSNPCVQTENITDDAITTDKIANNAVTTAKLADDSVGTQQIAAQSIGTTEIAPNAVTTTKITDANITTAKLADNAVTTAKIVDDAITTAKIADGAVNDDRLASSSVSTAKIANVAVTDDKLASNAVITSKISDANVTTVKIADSNVTLGKLASDLKQTTISDSDTQLPTSGAVVDYVAAQLQPFGGFEAVATEVAFPNTQPVSGVAISISDAGGVVINGSGVSTTGRTVGGSTVTINGFPSSLYNETLVAGVGLIVTSTGSSQTYNYHKILGKEDDIKQLSDDINDFNARYRVGSSNPTSALDSGDLFFNTGTGKLLVYNGTNSAWEEAQSVGNFFISTLSPAFDNTTQNFTLSNAPTNVQQVLLSINGVLQKPNAGTSTPSEGFALDGNTVKLSAAPATGSDYFAVVMGSTVNIGTPSNGTVTTDKLASGAVTEVKIADDAVTAAKLANNSVVTANIQDSNITAIKIGANEVTTAKIAADAVDGTKIADDSIDSEHYVDGSIDTAHIADQAVDLSKLPHGDGSSDGKFLRANNGADPTFESIPAGITINNQADNRVITATGTTDTLNSEGNLTFSGDVLQVSSTTQGLGAKYINTGNEYTNLQFSAARTAARNALGIINAKWNNSTEVAAIYLQTGDDTTNKDDGVITFFTRPSGGNLLSSMVIEPNGNVTMPRQAAMSFNNADNITNFGTSHNNDPIHFGTTQVSKGGMTASNTMSRMTVPTAGVYLCTGMYAGSGNGAAPGDGMQLNLYRNGSVYPEDQAFPITSTSGSNGEEWYISFSILANASANDYFEIAMSNVDTNSYISTERGNFQVTLLH